MIVAQCQWPSVGVQNQVLKAVCQAMAREKLHKPFWVNKYYVRLLGSTVKQGAVHYKVHISEGKADLSRTLPSDPTRPGPFGPGKTGPRGTGAKEREGEKTAEDRQEEVEDWQKEVEEEEEEEEEDMEDWQKEVEEEEVEEDTEDRKEVKKRMMKMALPFLSGLSQAGFLFANLKESGGGDLLVQVGLKHTPEPRCTNGFISCPPGLR